MKRYKANGKLLITGEYLVLKGAKAFAVPLNKGQQMTVETTNESGLYWQAHTPKGLWFEVQFDNELAIVKHTDYKKATDLQRLLQNLVENDSAIQNKLNHCKVTTHLEFDPNWGWGSSSTLLHLLAQWLKIDPYKLMDNTMGGSGYDIACAGSDHPIFYRRQMGSQPYIERANFKPPFIRNMGIVYLNKKQSSAKQVKSFLESGHQYKTLIEEVSLIADEIVKTEDIYRFMKLMHQHEKLIAEATGLTPVQELLFPSFGGAIKSLGAWGGDFALFVSDNNYQNNKNWFEREGYPLVMPFEEVMVKEKH